MQPTALHGFALGCALSLLACSSSSADSTSGDSASASSPAATGTPASASAAGVTGSSSSSASPTASNSPSPGGLDVSGLDPEKPLYDTAAELISFVDIASPKSLKKRWKDPQDFLSNTFGVGSVWLSNQGNRAISHPHGSRKACLEGLKGVTLQTADQKRACGADYMVPIYKDGKPESAKTCIDVFEFPNRPCELPVVWIAPSRANEVCQLQGKRLCTQDEWVLACRGDPGGADLQDYAYGADLDLTACHTQGERAAKCDPTSVKSTWATCSTDTAPTGSFPRCRSRFGVFDQHGNVAEIMKRWDPERERTVTQLKGSAFFYEKISMRPTDPPSKQKYPDHCAHDPRWHVENLDTAGHMMYHLGFRCCKDVGDSPE
ncbi:MAG: SUMF1/EgtB/PvdO family nonheme iron enzyme [Polyangiaceae bacterium]